MAIVTMLGPSLLNVIIAIAIPRITPFRVGDTVTFAGLVTGKRVEDGNRIVECRVEGTNQRGELVCLSDATMVVPP